MNAQASMHMDT